MADNEVVLNKDSQSSTPSETQNSGEAAPKMYSKEDIEKMIADRVSQTLGPALAQAEERGRRSLQSQQDRNRAQLQEMERQRRSTKNVLEVARKRLATLDPEAEKDIRLQELQEEVAGREEAERQVQAQMSQAAFFTEYQQTELDILKEYGVDPNDTGIDWGADAPTALQGLKRLATSAAKLAKVKDAKTREAVAQELKAAKDKLKELNIEVNSVNTSEIGAAVGGAPTSSRAAFVRYVNSLSDDEYVKRRPEIDAARQKLKD